MKLLSISKSKITKYENGGNEPEVALIHCNTVNNDSQRDLRVLDTFVPNKSFCHLLNIFPKNYEILKTFDSEFLYIGVLLTDPNCEPLEIKWTLI